MQKQLLVLLVCLISVTGFGLDATLMKISSVENPLTLAGIKLFGTFLFLLITHLRIPRIRQNYLFVTTILCSTFSSLFFIAAIKLIPVADALLLFYSSVIWSCIYKIAARIFISRLDLYTAVAVFAGNFLLLYEPSPNSNFFGYGFGLIAGICFAGFLFTSEYLESKDPGDKWIRFDAFLFALLIVVSISFCHMVTISYKLPSNSQVALLLIDGILYGFAYCVLFKALKLASAHLVNIYFGAFEPLAGIFTAYLILGEDVRESVYLALIVIVTPLVIRNYILYRQESLNYS